MCQALAEIRMAAGTTATLLASGGYATVPNPTSGTQEMLLISVNQVTSYILKCQDGQVTCIISIQRHFLRKGCTNHLY